jgi:hypothetical protein
MVEQIAQMVVHGEAWTVKDLFVLPNEYVYWSESPPTQAARHAHSFGRTALWKILAHCLAVKIPVQRLPLR